MYDLRPEDNGACEYMELTDEDYEDLCKMCEDTNEEKNPMLFKHIEEIVTSSDRPVGPDTFKRDYRLCQPTPFILLAQNGHLAAVQYFLTHKIFNGTTDVNQKGTVISKATNKRVHGATALWVASTGGHLEIVKLLLSKGATVDLATGSNSTPLRGASFHGHLTVMEELLSHKANINTPNSVGQSPLLIAVLRDQEKAVRFLISRGADMNQRTVNGYTAVHLGAAKGRMNMLKLLIEEHGMKPDFKDADSSSEDYVPSPIYLAASTKMIEVVRYFRNMKDCPSAVASNALFLLGSTLFECSDGTVEAVREMWEDAWDLRLKAEEKGKPLPVHKWKMLPLFSEFHERKQLYTPPANMSLAVWYSVQSLMIRERIMGRSDPGLIFFLVHRGYRFCKPVIGCPIPRLQLSLELFKYALELTKFLNMKHHQGRDFVDTLKHDLEKDLCTIQSGLSKIVKEWNSSSYSNIRGDSPPDFAYFASFAVEQLDFLIKWMPGADLTHLLASTLMLLYHWMRYITQVDKQEIEFCCIPPEHESLHRIGRELVKKHLYTPLDGTLLHLAVGNIMEPLRKALPQDYNPQLLVSALLEWGANKALNIVNIQGKTPVHVAILFVPKLCRTNPIGAIALFETLLEYNCDMYSVTSDGESVHDLFKMTPAVFQERFQLLSTLSASSCREIIRSKIPYKFFKLPSRLLQQIHLYDKVEVLKLKQKQKDFKKERLLMDEPT